jgi:hypothetical protein
MSVRGNNCLLLDRDVERGTRVSCQFCPEPLAIVNSDLDFKSLRLIYLPFR